MSFFINYVDFCCFNNIFYNIPFNKSSMVEQIVVDALVLFVESLEQFVVVNCIKDTASLSD